MIYVVAQLLGAFMGFGVLKLLTPENFSSKHESDPGFCTTAINPHLSTFQGFIVEFIISAVLVLVCCGVWDPRNAKHHDSVAIKFGLTISALAMCAGPYTGASMNPARSFGPALWNGYFVDHWVYWVAPLAAGFLTSFIYKVVFWREAPNEERKQIDEEFPLRNSSNNKSSA